MGWRAERTPFAAKHPQMWQRAGCFPKTDHFSAPGYNYILEPDYGNNWTVAINSLIRKGIKLNWAGLAPTAQH